MLNKPIKNTQEIALLHDIKAVMDWVGPYFKLSETVATNPWHHLTNQPINGVFSKVAMLSEANPYGGFASIKAAWEKGIISSKHLYQASQLVPGNFGREDLVLALFSHIQFNNQGPFWKHASNTKAFNHLDIQAFILKHVGKICVKYQHHESLRQSWFNYLKSARKYQVGLIQQLYKLFKQLPEYPIDSIAYCLNDMGVGEESRVDYLNSITHAVFGWSSLIKSWHNQQGKSDSDMLFFDYLSILVGIDWAFTKLSSQEEVDYWLQTLNRLQPIYQGMHSYRALYWVWQLAFELSYQETINKKVLDSMSSSTSEIKKETMVITCIDTRSERLRRALEVTDPTISTIGYAGFFGIPLKVMTETGKTYNQAPVIVTPSYTLDLTGSKSADVALEHYLIDLKKDHFFSLPAVEVLGPIYGFKLAKEYLLPRKLKHKTKPVYARNLSNCVINSETGQVISLEEKVAIAYTILSDNQMAKQVPSTVIMVSHYASSVNNPHQSLLNCGACGGQSGSLNVSVATAILNDAEVKKVLEKRHGYDMVDSVFIAAAHNTTTDDVTIIDKLHVDKEQLDKLEQLFASASKLVRHERRETLYQNYSPDNHEDDEHFFNALACSHHETRPEWGLVNNATMFIAPRELTKAINLNGRAFLNEYDFAKDDNFEVLDKIIAGPLVVAHWINMQYFASTVDNDFYGSGDKTIHNVIGEGLGVLTGSSGDLRIGLPRQSLHDGKQWMHQIGGLNVYIAMPQERLEQYLNENDGLNQLVSNGWLNLLCVDADTQQVLLLKNNQWCSVA